jgi:hypothetical protein
VILGVVIAILVIVLVQVAIIEPNEIIKQENYYKTETRVRMDNIRQAEILWDKKKKSFTDNLDSLISFIKNDSYVAEVVAGIDSVTGRSTNPFKVLSDGNFTPESLYLSPKSGTRYIVKVDTSIQPDTVINRRGQIIKVDTIISIGTRYYIEDVDGYGTIGDINNDARKNTASWE